MKILKPLILLMLSIVFLGCEMKGKTETRLQIVKEFIKAVQTNDTLKLFDIVDTGSLFQVQDKEYLLFETGYMRKHLGSCSVGNIEEKLTIKEMPVYRQDYIIPFCQETSNSPAIDSFNLIITFVDYAKPQKIQYFSVEKPIRFIKTKPLPIN